MGDVKGGELSRTIRAHSPALVRVTIMVAAVLELTRPGKDILGADGVAVGLVLLAAGLSGVFPRLAAGLAVAGGVIGYAVVQQTLVTSVAGLLGVVVLVRHRTPAFALVGTVAVAVAVASWNRYYGLDPASWLIELIVATAVTAAVAGVTAARRSRREAARAEKRLRELEIAAQRRDAVLAERARIARELHDLVAHSVSVIAALAETAPFSIEELPPAGKQRFAEIATTARGGLGELRDLLSVLRRDDPASEGIGRDPVPDLQGIHRLVDEHRRAGGTVDFNTEGELSGVPIAVEIAAHRIVQEALTNVRQHTRRAHAKVVLTRAPDRLVVRVRDTGPRLGVTTGSGHGLLGMQERAAALTGTLHAGPDGDGFQVSAALPLSGHESLSGRTS